jgi:small-conductance mechanosensitive channel
MHRTAWRRACGLCLIVCLIVLGLALASRPAVADTPATPEAAAPAGSTLSAAQAHSLLAVLNDPAKRSQLVTELQALEKVLPATPEPAPATTPAPAQAAKPAAPASPVAAVAHAVNSSGLLSQLVVAAPRWALGLIGEFASLRHVLRSVPASWDWLTQTAHDEAVQGYLMRAGFGLVVVVLPAALVWLALHWLLRPRRLRLGALAKRDEAAAAPPQEKRKLAQRFWGPARLLAFAALAFILDAAPVAAFAVVGTMLTPALTDPGPSQALVLAIVDAFAAFAGVLCIARAVFAPDIPTLRLLPMQDRTAAAAVRWVAWLDGVPVFGMAILTMAVSLGLDPAAELALEKLVLLIDHVLLVAIVLVNRHAIALRLRSPKRRSGVFASVLTGLSEVWHIVAIVLIVGLWLIWAADWQGGLSRLLEFVVTAIAVGIVTRLLTEGMLIALRHALRVADPNGQGDSPLAFATGARPRAQHYYPVLSAAITVIMAVTGLIVLLELCGVASIGWLLGSTLGWQIFSAAVSIAITLCVAVVLWESVNVGFDRHLDRLSRQAQQARVARLRTLLPILRTAMAITILIVVGLTVLSQIGINIAPLLAGAGIVGVAIGFGSQKLVQDLITGLFLLLEDAMQVGDWVTLAGVSGSVEKLSIRTIRLRAGDGSLHIIPFSSVTMVNNTNRGLGNAAVSVTVAAREDPDEVGDILKAVVAEMRNDPQFKPMILSDLQYWGVDKVDGSSMVLVGQIVCTDSGRWGVQREFNRRYRKRFRELGIDIPNPTQTLLLRHGTAARPAAPESAEPQPTDTGQTAATVAASPPS